MAIASLILSLICSWVEQVSRVSFPEQDWSELVPHLVVGPMFAEDVCRIATTGNVLEIHGVGRNGFACEVVLFACSNRPVWGKKSKMVLL